MKTLGSVIILISSLVFIVSMIGLIKNKWTYDHMKNLNDTIYDAARKNKISDTEFMRAHELFPSYSTVANPLRGWDFNKFMSGELRAILRKCGLKN